MNHIRLNDCDYCGVSKDDEFLILDVYNKKHKWVFSIEVCSNCFKNIKNNKFKDKNYEYKKRCNCFVFKESKEFMRGIVDKN